MLVQRGIRECSYKADGFILKYQRLIKDTVIPYQLSVLKDEARGAEKSHVVKNFINAASVLRGEGVKDGFYGQVFQDSDAAKWIEAASYSLMNFPDESLENEVDWLIDIIAAAQDTDGYLNTYYTIKDRDKRFTNLLEGHELYCSGHMIEAACAYYEATGKKKLINIALKNVECIYSEFITKRREGYPGHPEIELSLLKLYRITGNKHAFELAKHFIDVRGVDRDFYVKEKKKRSWTVWGNRGDNYDYQQSGEPVRSMTEAVGHAVRAVYLYTAMAELAAKTNDVDLASACRRIWRSIVDKKLYITGGIGATVNGEAFSVSYDLPNDTAYCETCASVGLMFFAERLLEGELSGEYADIMERAFYNTVLAGIALDGKSFFYVNPLEVVPGISGIASTHWHTLPTRPGWYACACCPPNAARFISSFGSYAYGESDTTAFCNMIAAGKVSFKNGVELVCKTNYPYGFEVKYEIISGGRVAFRIPAWSENTSLLLNGKLNEKRIKNGYVELFLSDGDEVILRLDSSVKRNYASTAVPELTGSVCLSRGPLVYCFEGVDNDGDVLSLSLKRNGRAEAKPYVTELLGGICEITAECKKALSAKTKLYSFNPPEETDVLATAVPYYTWANRGENQMRVWLNEVR